MKTFVKWITDLFDRPNAYQEDIEFYLESKQPKSTAEVEFWIKQYEQELFGKDITHV